MDLNVDVKFLILECLDLKDLVAMTETNRHFSILAEDVFRRKYSKEIIEFIDTSSSRAEHMNHIENSAKITDFPTAVTVLKRFGSSISRLLVSYSAYNDECRTLHKLINEYCSTLTEIIIEHDTSNQRRFYNDIKQTFVKIKKITINGFQNNRKVYSHSRNGY